MVSINTLILLFCYAMLSANHMFCIEHFAVLQNTFTSEVRATPTCVVVTGGGLFVSIVIVGTLCIKSPFRLEGGLFVRDCAFFIAAVFWSYFCLRTGVVRLWQALGKYRCDRNS